MFLSNFVHEYLWSPENVGETWFLGGATLESLLNNEEATAKVASLIEEGWVVVQKHQWSRGVGYIKLCKGDEVIYYQAKRFW
jgi:hypothetical protein